MTLASVVAFPPSYVDFCRQEYWEVANSFSIFPNSDWIRLLSWRQTLPSSHLGSPWREIKSRILKVVLCTITSHIHRIGMNHRTRKSRMAKEWHKENCHDGSEADIQWRDDTMCARRYKAMWRRLNCMLKGLKTELQGGCVIQLSNS